MKGSTVLFSSGKDDWRTPKALFERYNKIYQFTLDAAADEFNHLCPIWLGPRSTIHHDALKVPWGHRNWLNPPYSMVKDFVAHAAEQARNGKLTVALLPARTDTRWFHEHIYNKPNVRVEFIKGRIKFEDANGESKNSAPFPSMIVTFFPIVE